MRVRLRPLRGSDLTEVHALLADPAVVRFMLIPRSESCGDSERFLLAAVAGGCADDAGWRPVVRAIIAGAVLIGLCGIVVQAGSEEAELWYLVHPHWQGQGAATDAARQMVAYAFETLGLHRVWACCVPENRASARVLEKLGMRREGLRRKNLKIQGQWMDSELYAILDDEWETWGALAGAAPHHV